MPRVDQKTFYANTLKKFGAGARGVAWSDAYRQRRRFKALLKAVGPLEGLSVVDAGCGTGALYLYMKEKNRLPGRYIGLDQHEAMVHLAKERTGQRILRRDLLADPLPEADWYLLSGTLNLLTRFETLLAIKRSFDASRLGVVFNLLKGKEREGIYNYWLPREIEKACRRFGAVTICEGYLEGDFTVRVRA